MIITSIFLHSDKISKCICMVNIFLNCYFAGILSVFCAQAGAKKVYAIEASNVAELIKEVVKENKLNDIVEVISLILFFTFKSL